SLRNIAGDSTPLSTEVDAGIVADLIPGRKTVRPPPQKGRGDGRWNLARRPGGFRNGPTGRRLSPAPPGQRASAYRTGARDLELLGDILRGKGKFTLSVELEVVLRGHHTDFLTADRTANDDRTLSPPQHLTHAGRILVGYVQPLGESGPD